MRTFDETLQFREIFSSVKQRYYVSFKYLLSFGKFTI